MTLLSEKYSALIHDNGLHDQAAQHPFQQRILGNKSKLENPGITTISLILLNLTQFQVIIETIESKLNSYSDVKTSLTTSIDPVFLNLHQEITNDIAYLQQWLNEQTQILFPVPSLFQATLDYVTYINKLKSPALLAHWYTHTLAILFGGGALKNLIRSYCYPLSLDNSRDDRKLNMGASYYSHSHSHVDKIRAALNALAAKQFRDPDAQDFLTDSEVAFRNTIKILDQMEASLQTGREPTLPNPDRVSSYLYDRKTCCFWSTAAIITAAAAGAAIASASIVYTS